MAAAACVLLPFVFSLRGKCEAAKSIPLESLSNQQGISRDPGAKDSGARARVHVCVNVCARARTEARASALLSVAVSVAAEFLRLAKWLVLGFGPERTTALHF